MNDKFDPKRTHCPHCGNIVGDVNMITSNTAVCPTCKETVILTDHGWVKPYYQC